MGERSIRCHSNCLVRLIRRSISWDRHSCSLIFWEEWGQVMRSSPDHHQTELFFRLIHAVYCLTQKRQPSVRCDQVLRHFQLERKYGLFYHLIFTSLVQFVLLRRNPYLPDPTMFFNLFRCQNAVNRGFRDKSFVPSNKCDNSPGILFAKTYCNRFPTEIHPVSFYFIGH